MKYDDSHLVSGPAQSESLYTLVTESDSGHDVFVMQVSKTLRESPGPRTLWLDDDGAKELLAELEVFIGHNPHELLLTVDATDPELRTIEAILALLTTHTAAQRRRILAYVRDRQVQPS